jgi:hypothetical protein
MHYTFGGGLKARQRCLKNGAYFTLFWIIVLLLLWLLLLLSSSSSSLSIC